MNLDEYQNLAETDAGNASLAGSIAQPRPVSDAEVAYKLTENIPVGTCTIELNEAGEPFFSFCSSRWLSMLQLDRAAVMADPAIAFRCVHPDDVEGFVAINAFVMRNHTPFFWRGRIVVGGEIRWVVIKSPPRASPTKSTSHSAACCFAPSLGPPTLRGPSPRSRRSCRLPPPHPRCG